MAVTTVSEVKTILQISGSSSDAVISTLIPIVSDYIKVYCRMTDQEIEDAPGLKLTAINMIKFQMSNTQGNATSETIGDYSVSYSNSYPDNIKDVLDNYRKPKVISDTYGWPWDSNYYEDQFFGKH